MSRRILITTFGSYGDINPSVGLALALRERGHTPVIATSAFYRDYVEREGIAFRAVRPDVNPNERALLARIMDARAGTQFLLRELMLPPLRDSYADLSAAAVDVEFVVTHPITFAGPIVAQERGLPWASTVLAPMSFFSAYDVPVFPPAPWAKHLDVVPGISHFLVWLARAVAGRWTEPVHRLRAERGLPRGGNPLFEGQHSPHLVLGLFSRVLGTAQPDWPPRTRITGPILYNGPQPHALSAELEGFLRAGPPPVVFTLGTSAVSAAGDFYETSVAAAARAGVRAVLLVGRHEENRPRTPGDSVLVVEHAPHAALFPRAAAIVHQAGIGTLQQALHAGRPMLIVPWAHDQPDNAWRATRLGVALTLSPGRYTAASAAAHLRRLLDERSFAERAQATAEIVRTEAGADVAAEAIEGLAEELQQRVGA